MPAERAPRSGPLVVPFVCLVLGAVLAGPLDVRGEAVAWLFAWFAWPVAGALVLDRRPGSAAGRLLCCGCLAPGWSLLTQGERLDPATFVAGSALSPVLLVVALIPWAARRERSAAPGLVVPGAVVLVMVLVGLGVAGESGGLTPSWLYVGAGLVAVTPFAFAALVVTAHRQVTLDAALLRALLAFAASGALLVVWVALVTVLATTDLPDQEIAAGVLTAVGALALLPPWLAGRRWLLARLFGPGRNPGAVHLDLARHMRRVQDHASLLTAVADSVAGAVRSPGARVTLGDTTTAEPTDEQAVTIPLQIGDQRVGVLAVAPRSPGERFGRADLRLLEEIAPQLAAVAQAVVLTEDLRAAHVRTLAALDADRARICSELHDVLGPLLAGLGMHVESLRAATAHEPVFGVRVADVAAGVDECRRATRRLVQDLAVAPDRGRFDDVLRELVVDWQRAAEGSGLQFLDDIEPVPSPGPAVELALRRIAAEALTNVVRHARATRCRLSLHQRDGTLELQVQDDGTGLADTVPGVGRTSMQRRAQEVGGVLELMSASPAGTVVRARVPAGRARVPVGGTL